MGSRAPWVVAGALPQVRRGASRPVIHITGRQRVSHGPAHLMHRVPQCLSTDEIPNTHPSRSTRRVGLHMRRPLGRGMRRKLRFGPQHHCHVCLQRERNFRRRWTAQRRRVHQRSVCHCHRMRSRQHQPMPKASTEVLVDTGSSGLRLLGSVLTLSLPAWTDASGTPLAECERVPQPFHLGSTAKRRFQHRKRAGRQVAIQVIEESTYPLPASCTGTDMKYSRFAGRQWPSRRELVLAGLRAGLRRGPRQPTPENPGCITPVLRQPRTVASQRLCLLPNKCQIPSRSSQTATARRTTTARLSNCPQFPQKGRPARRDRWFSALARARTTAWSEATVIQLDDTRLVSGQVPHQW